MMFVFTSIKHGEILLMPNLVYCQITIIRSLITSID